MNFDNLLDFLNDPEDPTVLCAENIANLNLVLNMPKEEFNSDGINPEIEIVPTFTKNMFIDLIKDMFKTNEEEFEILRDNYHVRVCMEGWDAKCIDRLSFYTILKDFIDDSIVLIPTLKSPAPLALVKWRENSKIFSYLIMIEIIEREDIGGLLITKMCKDSLENLFNKNNEKAKLFDIIPEEKIIDY